MARDFTNYNVEGYKLCVNIDFQVHWITKHLNKDPETILEFGSYDGGDGVRYKKTFPNCRVISIEACPIRFNLIKDLENKFDIEAYNYAVCDTDGQIEFFQVADENVIDNPLKFGSSGSINQRTDKYKNRFSHITEQPGITVDSIRLDTFCSNNNITDIDFVHCDVEGAEHRVVMGMGVMRPKLILLEMHLGKEYYGNHAYDTDELHSHMLDLGYAMVENTASQVDRLYYYEGRG